ncbi:hypothetical protein [Hungatella sp.]|nr:hypothetical protein [Hungatella sp.]
MERIEHVSLLPSEAYDRRQRDEAYLMELKEENLLFAYRTEAGLNGRSITGYPRIPMGDGIIR